MERILFNEVEILSKKLKAKKIFAIDFKDKITTFESESKRINKLFSEYAIGLDKIITNDLLQACENFLKEVNRYEVNMNLYKSFYSVRNFIVHDYRNISKKALELFLEVNQAFENLSVELIIRYKETQYP
ncbi:MAG: hypothetical protein IPG78_03645 [Ignavibacteria bacterium]|nr:hypothetical protein [Ignavibacteria bacterium]